MQEFLTTYSKELTNSAIFLGILIILVNITRFSVRKIGIRSGINTARINLINRYVSVIYFLIALFGEAFIFGTNFEDLALVFTSVFAVIGIGLFAVWSILSNITSGVIMFFSFPYKVGDKIEIHDKDFPIRAIIEDIRAFQLHLRTEEGDLVTYPNNLILQKPISLLEKDAIEELENQPDLI